jgi:hypothetical protein
LRFGVFGLVQNGNVDIVNFISNGKTEQHDLSDGHPKRMNIERLSKKYDKILLLQNREIFSFHFILATKTLHDGFL